MLRGSLQKTIKKCMLNLFLSSEGSESGTDARKIPTVTLLIKKSMIETLKGLSQEIDKKNFDKNLQNLT
jgi:hypothetical protein